MENKIILAKGIAAIAIDNLETGEVAAEITNEEIYTSREIYAVRIIPDDEE